LDSHAFRGGGERAYASTSMLKMFNASPLTRALVVTAQVVMTPLLYVTYFVKPKMAHRFVGYLEETACETYANIINQVETPGTPLHEEWSTLPAP